MIARSPTTQRIAGSWRNLSASFTSSYRRRVGQDTEPERLRLSCGVLPRVRRRDVTLGDEGHERAGQIHRLLLSAGLAIGLRDRRVSCPLPTTQTSETLPEPCGSIAVPRTARIGASSSLLSIPTKVASPDHQRPFLRPCRLRARRGCAC